MTNDDAEIFRPAPGCDDGYEVTDRGRVLNRGRELSISPKGQGREISVWVRKDGKLRRERVARLVLLAFGQKAPCARAVVLHLDGDLKNNALPNLCWRARRSAYVPHGYPHGIQHPQGKVTDERVCQAIEMKIFGRKNNREIAKELEVSPSWVGRVFNGQKRTLTRLDAGLVAKIKQLINDHYKRMSAKAIGKCLGVGSDIVRRCTVGENRRIMDCGKCSRRFRKGRGV